MMDEMIDRRVVISKLWHVELLSILNSPAESALNEADNTAMGANQFNLSSGTMANPGGRRDLEQMPNSD